MPAVNNRIFKSRWTKYALESAALVIGMQLLLRGCSPAEEPSEGQHAILRGLWSEVWAELEAALADAYMPAVSLATENEHETYWLLQEQMDTIFPAYGYFSGGKGGEAEVEQRTFSLAEIDQESGWEPVMQDGALYSNGALQPGEALQPDEALHLEEEMLHGEGQLLEGAEDNGITELLRAENDAALDMLQQNSPTLFTPHEKQAQVDLAPLSSYETLVRQFYTIDASTMAGREQLNVEKFLSQDMTIQKEGEGYQILIYHTHSQEAFADSVKGERSDTIMGMGDLLTQILTDTYGYKVLHHDGQYDVKSRDDAYSASLPDLERILEENPSIEVVIDLHRDAVPEGTRLVTEIDGRPTAKFMFFNGLSRTKNTGNIGYLYNENLDANLAFSFQMQLKAMEYYPGLPRRIYLKGYRYNMHLRPRSLLIELGAQNNTVEEARNACGPLAHILDLVLSGQ